MPGPVLVTGATGFVGSAVANALATRGHSLRLLVRPGSDRRNLRGLDAELVEGDLGRPESLARAVAGCRYVFHVAADYRLWVPDPDAMMRANVEGSSALLRAAHVAGVERAVYCSSVAALGVFSDGTVADERTPVDPAKIIGVYKQSKYRAEQAVLALARELRFPVVVVNPSTPVGPRDVKPTPTGVMIRDAAAGRMPAYVDTGLNIVHVDDVAEGHLLALERGEPGEKYILGGEDLSLGALFTMIAGLAGVRPPLVRLPRQVLWPVAVASEGLARGFGIEPRVTREMLAMSRKKMFFSSAKARAALGYAPRPARDAVADAIAWFRPGEGRRMNLAILLLTALSLAAWLYLVGFHGRFWQSGPKLPVAHAATGPAVAIVVPARDEADSIDASLRSLLAQDYRGAFHVWLVDDRSTDGTGAIARAIGDPRLTVVDGGERPPGWSGKLWAVSQGLAAARDWAPGRDGFVLLTDADILHDPTHLGTLVTATLKAGRDQSSEMVELRCASLPERALVPAFVFFFQLLYPFARVETPASSTAAAAGGVVLIARRALDRIGGIEAVRGALIDDVALATAVKRSGGRIWLGHATQARSVRPYPGFADVWRMVSRTAYVQLRFSPAILALTILGLALVWLVPAVAVVVGGGIVRLLGVTALALSLGSYLPTLRRFGLSPLWTLLLPAVSVFYMAATVASAVDHHRGRGVVWKSRAYRGDEATS